MIRSVPVLRLAWAVPLALLAAMATLGARQPAGGAQGQGGESGTGDGAVYLIEVTGDIDLGLAPYLRRVLREAADAEADLVVVRVDTPGGRLDAVLQMREALLSSTTPTVAFIDSTAFSAGALVALASGEIYFTPGGVMGAATPVVGGTGEVADAKTISAVRSTFAATAEVRARSPEVAAAMVDPAVEIDGLVEEGELLTLTAGEALDVGYADGVVDDLDDLLVELGFSGVEPVVTSPGLAERLARILTNPIVASILLSAGTLAVIIDVASGGVGVGAAIGLGLLSLFFWGHLVAGLAGWEDAALIALGLALIAAEVFVVPGFGVAGVLGVVALASGVFLAMVYRDFDVVTTADLTRAALTVVVVVMIVAIGLVTALRALSRSDEATAHLESLRPPPAEPGAAPRPLQGATGTALSDLRPSGIAEIEGERIDVITSGEQVQRGESIVVVRDDGYRRVVRRVGPWPVESPPPDSSGA